ncbi:MAG: thioredoxin domain-containing protein [Deltaproteobacteria bacterium]|nr:thioredoxin domain-containing protein [Deltaproteobacteria bacterium]
MVNKENPNRLSNEQSPYLLQHQHNPVDWYPWGDEAFAAAKRENRPVFLSIGYATCHWCHVMAHESFEDNDVAAVLNRDFISIKVDREERPDVDHIYMTVAQMLTGSGGWPLSILMTPDKKPFFAATYIPKEARYGSAGFIEILEMVKKKWQADEVSIKKNADEITAALKRINTSGRGGTPNDSFFEKAYARLAMRFDSVQGGFSDGTKFPAPHNLIFLLRHYQRTGIKNALHMAETTLKNMRAGGIFDQLGFGFHRYSTDSEWLVPHFEKMLYDQAMLMLAYTEAFEATGNSLYAQVVDEIVSYLKNKLRSSEGTFFSAEDADSEGVEGKYYVWTLSEINAALTSDEADAFIAQYNIEAYGNFESHQTPPQTNIPHLTVDSLERPVTDDETAARLASAVDKLLLHRSRRVRPLLDDKVLTDWNGLTIAALAKAGRALNNDEYITMAEQAAAFLKKNMTKPDGTLWHRYRNGVGAIGGHLDDYAFLVLGVIELYQATFDVCWLEWALSLVRIADEQFGTEDGSYCLASVQATDLIVRPKEYYDGAFPSGNAVMHENLVRLARLLGNAEFEARAHRLSGVMSASAGQSPDAHTYYLTGLLFALGPSVEIVVTGEKNDERTLALLDAARNSYTPNRVVLLKTQQNTERLTDMAPYTAAQSLIENSPTAYVCAQNHCKAPTHSPAELKAHVHRIMTPR